MRTIQGPGIFLAQFLDSKPPFDRLDTLCAWASALGYTGVQLPAWDSRCINLKLAAESKS
jgi:sugar phosphate isomerase/epimerase